MGEIKGEGEGGREGEETKGSSATSCQHQSTPVNHGQRLFRDYQLVNDGQL